MDHRAESMEVERTTRYFIMPIYLKLVVAILSGVGIFVGIYYLFNLHFFGFVLFNFAYYYLFIAIFVSASFLLLKGRKKDARKVPWYDILLASATFAIGIYIFSHAEEIAYAVWYNIPLGIIFWLLLIEGSRRTGGPIYFMVVVLFSLYPLFSSIMPGFLWGQGLSFHRMWEGIIFADQGLMGLITKVMAEILFGFLAFAGILLASGGGEFFMKIASCLLGRYRGGPAKVSVLSSCLFGTLSGSVLSNVAGTGSFTIPTMKRIGYPPHYAGAIEACASTGGALMPPVMGGIAFIMCEFLGIAYSYLIVAAAIPAILYYFGLMMQVDAYAATHGLKGLPKEEVPKLGKTLKEGWVFIFILIFMTWGLVFMQWERMAPWYATALMIPLSFFRKETRLTPKRLYDAMITIGSLVTQSAAIIIPMGFIYYGLTVTGVAGSFTAGLVALAHNNEFLLLLMGMVVCYVLGIGGMDVIAYLFLALTMAPAVLRISNLNPLSVHLFLMYNAMLACITPPVAAAAFLGATIAGADVMKTSWMSMRLGIVLFFIPWFFVFNPSLVLQGNILSLIYILPLVIIGIIITCGGIEGYLMKVGRLALWQRPLLIIAGLLIGFPEWTTSIIGIAIALLVIFFGWTRGHSSASAATR